MKLNKRLISIILSLSILVWMVSVVYADPAYSTQHTKSCPNECIEGRYINFDVVVKNTGSSDFTLKYIEIKDRSDKSFARRSTNNALAKSEAVTVNDVDGYLPPPTSGSTLYYKICLNILEHHWYGDSQEWYCTSEYSTTVTPGSVIECDYDYECSNSQKCINHKCSSVSCGYCQYVSNHNCVSYECCANSDCSWDETCEGHLCQDIWCYCGEIKDHQCIKYECCKDDDCPENHYCSNNKCIAYDCLIDTDCNDDQYCSNNKCKTVYCDESIGYVENHECKEYECKNNWVCNDDEYCSDHNCVKLNCNFGYPKNHSCSSYWPIIIGVIIVAGGIVTGIIMNSKKKKQ